VAMNNDLSSNM